MSVVAGGDKNNSKIRESLLAAAALFENLETLKEALPDINEEFRACDLGRSVLLEKWNPYLKVKDRELGGAAIHLKKAAGSTTNSNPKPLTTLYDEIDHDDDLNDRVLKKLKK